MSKVLGSFSDSSESFLDRSCRKFEGTENPCFAHKNISGKVFIFKCAYQNVAKILGNNKQLLDEVEHDIMNYQNRCLCYLPKPSDTRF